MSIKLQQLMHFVMVVEEGGFRAASHRANRSQQFNRCLRDFVLAFINR